MNIGVNSFTWQLPNYIMNLMNKGKLPILYVYLYYIGIFYVQKVISGSKFQNVLLITSNISRDFRC